MFSLQRLIGRGEIFFDLLEASADEARQSARALFDLLKSPDKQRVLDEFIIRRRQEKKIKEEITERLCTTFVTPLEREDIESLSNSLYKIPKTIEKFSERLMASRPHLQKTDFMRQAELLDQTTDVLCQMVKHLRSHPKVDIIKERNDRLQFYEGEADKLVLELLRDLYNGNYDPIQVIVLRDLYELLEKVIDRCRDAGNVVFQIVLKYS
jgi:uncharacterized protein Yka (UPF0111/DUF47 family)